jgi:hypothetical protein
VKWAARGLSPAVRAARVANEVIVTESWKSC